MLSASRQHNSRGSALEGYIISLKTIKEKIRVVEESPPFAAFHPDEITIFVNLNVCYAEEHEALSDILYSTACDKFLVREVGELVTKALGPTFPWVGAGSFKVEIEGIGES